MERGPVRRFSKKQLTLLNWWCKTSPYTGCQGVICDGAVRSGKTLAMSLSFFAWACSQYDGMAFALCGKTIASLRRNLVTPLLPLLRRWGFDAVERLSKNQLEIRLNGHKNRFYLFGGRDESSAGHIQGVTLAGVLFDEAALMPRSFVEQAVARCSVEGARLWFSCNPESPYHWFYQEWIQKAAEKNLLYLHFTMEDNPSLSREVRARYERLYSGRFYRRFVLGEWVQAEGLIYPGFSAGRHLFETPPEHCDSYVISCDYGTVNPTSMGLWGRQGEVWYRLREDYYDSKKTGVMRTDEEHYAALCRLAGDCPVELVVVDPSAASFMECIRRHGVFRTVPAVNQVADGIRRVSSALYEERIRFSAECRDTIREFSQYVWAENAPEDTPVKEHDHAMDDIRYFVSTVLFQKEEEFFAAAIRRRR